MPVSFSLCTAVYTHRKTTVNQICNAVAFSKVILNVSHDYKCHYLFSQIHIFVLLKFILFLFIWYRVVQL